MAVVPDLQTGSALSYLLAFVVPALDAVIPVLPGESVVIALGVATAGSDDPLVVVLVLLAAAGACAGDNLCYALGRWCGPWVHRHLLAGEKGRRNRAWAERQLARYGGRLIVLCRFVPGGRTAVTLTCGVTGYPWRRFLVATAVAGLVWATYAFLIGRLGGKVFGSRPWLALVVALGVVFALSGAVEVGRRGARWWRARSVRPPAGG